MAKNQRGFIYEASKVFYVRYCTTEIVDGQPKRVQRSHRLIEKGGKYTTISCKAVKDLRDDFMRTVNQQEGKHLTLRSDMLISDCWERYLAYCQEIVQVTGQPRKRGSTLHGYKQIWNQHLKARFEGLTLRQYEPAHGNRLLRSLTASQNRTTIKHIKSVASALFSYAVEEEILTVNPWLSVKLPDDAVPPKPTGYYTLEEAENLISALVDHADCQLVIALSCFLGLRPSEIAGLRWEDFDPDTVHIRRGVVNGVVAPLKTIESAASLPLVDSRILIPLELWRQQETKRKKQAMGYVFEASNGSPVQMNNLLNRVLKPHILGNRVCIRCEKTPEPSKVQWKGLYAGRRGACTAVVETSNANVAQALLRHKSMATTLAFYKKQISPAGLLDGLKRLAATNGTHEGTRSEGNA